MTPNAEKCTYKLDGFFNSMLDDVACEWADYPRGVTPYTEIYKAGNIKLIKFKNENATNQTPLLIIPSLINRWYVLDLTEKVSFIKHFLKNSEVYLVDWGYPGVESSHLPLSFYYHKSIKRAVRQILKRHDVKSVDMMGYCVGGTLVYAFSCLEPELVNKAIFLTAPIDFSKSGILLDYAEHFPVKEFESALDIMPGELIASSFNFIQPMGTYHKTKMFYDKCNKKSFTELFTAMERWISDPVDFPAKAYKELLTDLYQDNKLFEGKLKTAEGITVDPSKRTAAAMILNAAKDHIAPLESTKLPEIDKAQSEFVTMPTGHIGITTGRQSTIAAQKAVGFLSEDSDEK